MFYTAIAAKKNNKERQPIIYNRSQHLLQSKLNHQQLQKTKINNTTTPLLTLLANDPTFLTSLTKLQEYFSWLSSQLTIKHLDDWYQYVMRYSYQNYLYLIGE